MTATAECPVCGRPQSMGLLDDYCTTKLERDLGDVAAIVAELDITLSRQARIGTSGGKSGVMPNHRDGYHQGASLAAEALTNTLTTWARDVKGVTIAAAGIPATTASWMLLQSIPQIRKHPAVSELVDEITDAIAQARRVVDRPADRVYLGQCMVETPDPDGRQVTCLAELWARAKASEVTCTVCGTEHEVAERRDKMLLKAEDMIVTVKEASYILGEVGGIRVTQASIRGYLHRGSRLQYRAPVEAKRFRLGDLLEVVLDEGERKSA